MPRRKGHSMTGFTQFVYNGIEVNEDQFLGLLDAAQDAIVLELDEIQDKYEVSPNTANAILYLRGRSRWTEAKEQDLIDRDHAGNPVDMNVILRGDF